MKNLKNLSTFLLLAGALAFSSCGSEEDKCADVTCNNGQVCIDGTCVGSTTNKVINSNITSDVTWTADEIYELGGRITVEAGATLTIEPGTIIKGQAGSGVNATALLVAKGAKIMANGTATKPIIFTSVADEITMAQVASNDYVSPNLSPTDNGLWGGIIILGNAPISASSSPIQIEGIPTTDQNGLYGGTDATDNSGSLTYVSIRHGGANIGNGNEINGLTLGGVGSGTVINWIEVIGNQDDGVEFFGGTVDAKNILVLNAGDDAIDTDQAWAGTLDNFIVICGDATDHALEIDGPEGTLLAAHTVKNGSVKGNEDSELGNFRSCARGTFMNLYFFGFADPSNDRGDFALSNPDGTNPSTCTTDNFTNGDLSFSALEIDVTGMNNPALTDIFKNGTDAHATIVTTATVGANKAAFSGWTWAAQASLLTDF
ncbi:MAG: hypothetical protein ACRBFS_01315 [Aureispira sp.]